MTKDQYLRMVEQTGEEIDWDRCPPDVEDFPPWVHTAIEIYSSLGNRVYPDVGFMGKDFTTLDIQMQLHRLDSDYEKELILDTLLFIEREAITESQRQIKAEYDKIKRS